MQEGSAEEESVLRAALDTLTIPICVLDGTGVIRLTAGAWGKRAPGGPHEPTSSFNYLRALEHAATRGDVHVRLIHDGVASVLAGRAPHFRLEYPVDTARQEWQLLRVVGLPGGGAVLTHADVTAQRTAEAQARHLSRRYETATIAAAVGVWILDIDTQTVSADAVLCRLLGYPTTQSQSWTEWRARVHSDDLALVDAVWQASCAPASGDQPERAFGPFEVRLADAHGNYRCFECRGHAVTGAGGETAHAEGTLHDVTDRRLAQEALQRSNAHLQELAQRLVSQK